MDALSLYWLLALTTMPPLVPNSALLVTAGVLASRGALELPVVLLVVAGSATLGDLAMHLVARRFGGPVRSWMLRRTWRRALLEWASSQMERHGVPFVATVCFLPGGRIVGALASGVVRYPVRRYLAGTGIAEAVWAAYSVGLGYIGSVATEDTLHAIGIGVGVSAVMAAAGASAQWAARRCGARRALRDLDNKERDVGVSAVSGDAGDRVAPVQPGDEPAEVRARPGGVRKGAPEEMPGRTAREAGTRCTLW
ncbi:DedA family protein [Streptomyces sp. NPDC059788]|uniref:DedA family protein n=1 Tax=Streptomyces sp. NPDC059788 TaxID=3346948 RepID=UPI003647AFF3